MRELTYLREISRIEQIARIIARQWTLRAPATFENLYAVTAARDFFIVAGSRGAILRSGLVRDPAMLPRFISWTAAPDTGEVRLVLEARSSSELTIERSEDLVNWTPFAVLEALNGSTVITDSTAVERTGFYRVRSEAMGSYPYY